MRKFIISIVILFFAMVSNAQKTIKKTLFFYEDSVMLTACGGVLMSSVYYFVSDTSNSRIKNSGYYIGILCMDRYGESFFQKGRRYLLTLDKDFEKIKHHMTPDTFETFYKLKRFYVLQNIKLME